MFNNMAPVAVWLSGKWVAPTKSVIKTVRFITIFKIIFDLVLASISAK